MEPIEDIKGISDYTKTLNSYLFNNTHDTEEYIKEALEKFLNSESDMMPLVESVLVERLEKITDSPDKFIEKLIKEKDEKIKELETEVIYLRDRVEVLYSLLGAGSPIVHSPLDFDRYKISNINPVKQYNNTSNQNK